jgi:LacI family transcriptional regulator
MKNVRLKDIAAKAGVSVTTVSLILNGRGQEMRLSDSLIGKVAAIAKSMRYGPHSVAKGLRSGRTRVLALIVEDISNHFFSTITHIVEGVVREKGYQLVCSSTNNDRDNTVRLIENLANGLVDGFLIVPVDGIQDSIRFLLSKQLPVVFIDRNFRGVDVPSVLVDNLAGIKLGMDHLFQCGYKKVLFVSVQLNMVQIKKREAGYLNAMKNAGHPAKILKVKFQEPRDQVLQKMEKAIRRYRPDAIFFGTNYLGMAGLECLGLLNLRIPDDIGVICFDDHELFRLYQPGITVIDQPLEQIVNSAAEMLFDRIEGKFHHQSVNFRENDTYLVSPKLIKRKSTKNNFRIN